MEAYVDPTVSRQKFDRELADYRKLEDDYLRRGWFLLKAEFPEVFVVFAAPRLNPPCLVFGALLDFTDYDYQPPSLRIVNPQKCRLFTLKTHEMPMNIGSGQLFESSQKTTF